MKKIILVALAILYIPLSIYGMVVCCNLCSWIVYVPVLIIGILLAFADFWFLCLFCAEEEMDNEMPLKEYEEYIRTGGK